jgi:ribosome modulation factor/uncharacterized protein (UPF0335 family)
LPRAAKKIEPQDEIEQQPPAPIDHNGESELTEAEKRSLLVNGLAEIERHTEEKDRVVSLMRTARKRLVANGFKPKLIDYALRLRKNDEAEEIEHRRAEAEIARFLNHPIGTQPEFTFTVVDRTPGVDRAFADGEQAGAEGKSCECPHVSGPNEQAWIKGWHEGQATLLSAFKKLEAKAEAEAADEEEGED